MATIKKDGGFNALPISYKRGNPIPLDDSAIWYSKTDMETYAASGATSYVGQIVVFVDEANNKSTAYIIKDTAGNLEEVGATVGTDGKSIVLDSKTLKLYGFDSATSTSIPVVGTDGKLTWTNKLTTSVGSSSTDAQIPTAKAVWDAIDNVDPMVFKGTLGTGGTITALPTASASNVGHTYKVITEGTYANQAAKVGDTFICAKTGTSTYGWTLIPSGDEPVGTVTNIDLADGNMIEVAGDATDPITSTGTIKFNHKTSTVTTGSYGDTSAQTPGVTGTFKVPSFTVDGYGHLTAAGEHTVTIPRDSTKQDNLNFDGTYNATTNKVATVSTVTGAVSTAKTDLIGESTDNWDTKKTLNAVKNEVDDLASTWELKTTLGDYGITDAKIENGTIILGNNSITPVTDVSGKADKATGLTGATKTKITYNSQGIVTAGANLEANDIPTLPQSKITNLTTDLSAKEVSSNKVTSWSSTTTDAHYPSEKLVKTALDGKANSTDLTGHINDTANPHNVTKSQVGLGNVTNNAQVKGLASGTTQNHIVTWGADGYTVKDSGKTVSDFVAANTAITGGTGTKITYDSKGLVTGSSSLTASDLPSHTHTNTDVTGLGTAATANVLTGTIADNTTSANLTSSAQVVTYVESKLTSAMNYRGKFTSLDDVTNPKSGDVAIVGYKEYIYGTTPTGDTGWTELGDENTHATKTYVTDQISSAINALDVNEDTSTVAVYPVSQAFPTTGETGKYYVAFNTGTIYTWNGTSYQVYTNAGYVYRVVEQDGKVFVVRKQITNSDVSGLGSLATKSAVSESDLTDELSAKISSQNIFIVPFQSPSGPGVPITDAQKAETQTVLNEIYSAYNTAGKQPHIAVYLKAHTGLVVPAEYIVGARNIIISGTDLKQASTDADVDSGVIRPRTYLVTGAISSGSVTTNINFEECSLGAEEITEDSLYDVSLATSKAVVNYVGSALADIAYDGNVNHLVQTSGDVLILDGGTSSSAW